MLGENRFQIIKTMVNLLMFVITIVFTYFRNVVLILIVYAYVMWLDVYYSNDDSSSVTHNNAVCTGYYLTENRLILILTIYVHMMRLDVYYSNNDRSSVTCNNTVYNITFYTTEKLNILVNVRTIHLQEYATTNER